MIRKDLLDKKYSMTSTFKKYKILISNKLLLFYVIIFFVLSVIYSLNFLKNFYNHNIVISVDSNINFGVLNGENQMNLKGEELIIHNLALFKRIKEFKSLLHNETTEKLRSKTKINLEEFDAKKMKLSNINEIYFFEIISPEKNNQKIQINILKKLEEAFSESFVNNILYGLENDELENYLSQQYTVIKSSSSSTNNKLKSIIKLNIVFISLMLLIYLINIQAFKFK